jgi:uncharacterized protein YqcC (DUF446 family)
MNEETTKRKEIEQKITEIEAEMKHLGMWQSEPLPESAFTCKEAFCADSMTFPQWLQFVFIPEVHNVLSGKRQFPDKSEVGKYASQQFLFYSKEGDELVTQGHGDGREVGLVRLLQELDGFF